MQRGIPPQILIYLDFMLHFEKLEVGNIIFHDRTGYPLEYLGGELFKDSHGMTHCESVCEIESNYTISRT